jgi:hypothetical protein
VTERTLGRLHAVQLLAREDVYYVDLDQWTVALGGADAAALIPVICGVLFGREVLVQLSGITVVALYEELAVAIKSQSVPPRISPLRWSFRTIVGAYNNFPEMDALYSFRGAVQPFPLSHGRRVLLSAMFLRVRAWELDVDSWRAAKDALLFGDEVDILDCEGRGAGHELFIEQFGDKARFTVGTCPCEDMVSLVLGCFTEEDQELTVEEDLLPARLAAGVQQRRLCAQSTDVALSNILRDERQRISSIALAGYRGGAYRPTEGLAGVIEYPSMRDSYRLTGQPALVLGAQARHAFTWVFVIQEVYSRMVGALAAGGIWRWFVYPAKPLSVSWSVPRTDVVAPTMETESSSLPMVTDAAEADVDLVAVAEGTVAAMKEETTVSTILDVFQQPRRCLALNDILPAGSPPKEVGLQRLLDWGELMAVMSGEMVVLPFTRDCVSSSVLRALGEAPLSWQFILANMTVGVFKVESVASMGRGTYTVSYVRRLAGPTLSVGETDPIRSMLKVEVYLDHRYGLRLTELAIRTSPEWLGVQMQPRVINVVASPVKQRLAKAPVLEESRKRSSQSAFIDDDEEDRHRLPVMMTDMSGQRFVVSKYGPQLVGANLSILFRTMTTQESRRRLFPQTFSLGPDYENVQWYQETANLFVAAEGRSSSTIGVRDRIRSRNTCFWGRIVDERFLQRVVLFTLEGFDSAEPRRLCLEHFSSSVNPPAVTTCAELVMCVRNLLATYEELWMLEWRDRLESMMTGYFERFEANENRFLDWAFAARHVMEFFYQLQRAAQQPRVGVVFAGRPRPLVLADELPDPPAVVDFIKASFRPYCDEVFKTENLWVWTQKKALLPPPAIFGVGAKVHPGKAKSRGDGNGAPDTTKALGENKVKGEARAKQATTGPTSSTTRFCIVDAFQYVGITGILEEKAVKACRGKDCIFTHVSGAPSKTYVHKAVFAGIQQALGRHGGPVKDAWAQAMRGRGKEVFQGPFGSEQG